MVNQKVKALIFDLNGTMIDDMHFHWKVWSDILNNDLGANLSDEDVRKNMYGKNHELLERVFGPGRFSVEDAEKISMDKEHRYQKVFKPHLQLITGLPQFLEKACTNKIPMAIGSAAIPFNIDFVLDNLNLRHYFASVVSALDVSVSKPHPETFLKAAQELKVSPSECLVFEDAPKGVEAAANAGMKAIALTTMHDEDEFGHYNNILFFIKDYTDQRLKLLF